MRGVTPPLSVTLAEAGVSCGKRALRNREIPVFAGMTI